MTKVDRFFSREQDMTKNKVFTTSSTYFSSMSLSRTTVLFYFTFAIISLFMSVSAVCSSPQHKSIFIETSPEGSTLAALTPSLCKQSGYKIFIEEEYKHILVKGKFQNVTDIEGFFRRALKGQNYSLILDEKRKELQVTMLGKKMLVNNRVVATPLPTENVADFPELLAEQQREILAYQEKYKQLGVDPVTELPLDQLAHMKEDEILAGAQLYENQGIDSVTGLPLDQLAQMKEDEILAGAQMYENQGIDSVTGLPLDQLAQMKEDEILAGAQMYENQGINSVTGLPLGEIEAIRAEGAVLQKKSNQDQKAVPTIGVQILNLTGTTN